MINTLWPKPPAVHARVLSLIDSGESRLGFSISIDQPPQSHPRKASRDASNTEPPALHAKHGLALDDLGLLILKL